MGNLWLLIAAPATVLAAVLFWRVFDIQHGDYEVQRAELRAERSKFDADFAQAYHGKRDASLDEKAASDVARLAAIEKEKEEERARAKMEGRAQIDALDKLLNIPLAAKQQNPQSVNKE